MTLNILYPYVHKLCIVLIDNLCYTRNSHLRFLVYSR